jgi:two-component system NtrC family response regulator
MDRPKLLIVDDDEAIRGQMKWALADDYEVLLAHDRESAVELVRRHRPGLVALDLGLPPAPREADEGLRALEEILGVDALIKVVVITGNQEKANAFRAIEQGAFDFFAKPVDLQEVRTVLKRAAGIAGLERENRSLKEQMLHRGMDEILGASPPMERVFATIRKVAATDASVLITGESGTGKELVARALHQASGRPDGPFVVINCGAIPETLLESELFGHEKGAFTSADARRRGKIEYADKGTLFLDEIGEISASLQVKLLRFLQERVIERVGGREAIPVDVRVVAATNRDLKTEIAERRFREDLYYRLGVVAIALPPLRERGEDVFLLAKAFLHQFAAQCQKDVRGFSADALGAMRAHAWPGNVRELENRIRRAVIMGEGRTLGAEDLELSTDGHENRLAPLRDVRERAEEEHVRRALLRCNWNISQAALELGVSRPTMHDLIKRYGLRAPGR